MSDPNEPRDDDAVEQPDETSAEQPPAEEQPSPPTRPSSPSAAAARRARRIGGRPAGAPRQDAESEQPGEPAAPDAAASVPAPVGGENDTPPGAPEPRTVVITAVPPWLNWAPAAVLGVGALAMALVLLFFSHSVWWGPDPKDVPAQNSAAVVRQHVLAAAKTCVAAANSYEYTDLDGYESRALACTTGDFTAQLQGTIEQFVKVQAPNLKARQTAQITRGGIEAITPDGNQWTILLFGQLNVQNTNFPKGRTDPFAAQVRMDKVNGKWLISALNNVSTPLS